MYTYFNNTIIEIDGVRTSNGGGLYAAPVPGSSCISIFPGDNLITKYASLSSVTPNLSARSTNNRMTMLIYPGKYDLGTAMLNMSSEYIDIIGMTGNASHVFITSANTTATISTSASNDVLIKGVTLDNTGGGYSYMPGNVTKTLTKLENVNFIAFTYRTVSSGNPTNYAGTYINCSSPNSLFGGDYVNCSGIFTDCAGGNNSFGGYSASCSGTFNNCTVVGYNGFSYTGTSSGIFNNCKCSGTGTQAFASAGTASGTFINCTAGTLSFGGHSLSTYTASGVFYNCTAADGSFGYVSSGKFFNCSVTSNTPYNTNFGSNGTASGKFINCFMNNIPSLASGGRITNCFDTNYNLYNGSA